MVARIPLALVHIEFARWFQDVLLLLLELVWLPSSGARIKEFSL
jgi:hypothetical protein